MTTVTEEAPKADSERKRSRRGPQGPRVRREPSREARRLATCILEVLGGTRTPTEAAKELSMPIPRYYLLEARALQGLVDACEPRPIGKVRSVESELEAAKKEAERLRRECARSAALVRVAQRTVGLSAPPPVPKVKPPGKGKGPRRPTVRALKAVERLKPKGEELPSPAAV